MHAAVDTNFITKTDREFMGIVESSIGGKCYNERTGEEIQKNMIQNEFVTNKLKINLSINMLEKHNETDWSDEFPKDNECLYFNKKDN